jgi:hypothetical protein
VDGKTIITVQTLGKDLKIFGINKNKDLKAPLERVWFFMVPVV